MSLNFEGHFLFPIFEASIFLNTFVEIKIKK